MAASKINLLVLIVIVVYLYEAGFCDGRVTVELIINIKKKESNYKNNYQQWHGILKVGAWPKLLLPAAIGHIVAFSYTSKVFSWCGLLLGLSFSLFDFYFIIFLNDYADQKVDMIRKKQFSDRAGVQVIQDKLLSARQVLALGLLSGISLLLVAFLSEVFLDRTKMLLLVCFAMGLLYIYSYSPFKLNYRGGGEIVEAFGVGVLLPLVNAYLQSGELLNIHYLLFGSLFFFAFSSAICSGIKDEMCDRIGGKKTVVVLFGLECSKKMILVNLFFAHFVFLIVCYLLDDLSVFIALPGLFWIFFIFKSFKNYEKGIILNEYSTIKKYRNHLHFVLHVSFLLIVSSLLFYRICCGI